MGDKENLDLTMKIGEDTQLHNLRGYPKVAHLMGSRPHYAIFRKFGRLTILNLLRLQAELLAVEDEIEHCLVKDDSSSDTNVKSYAVNFRKLNNAKAPHDEQRELLAKSLKKLANYHELLLSASQVAKLNKPTDKTLEFFREWLRGETDGKNFQCDELADGLELLRTWDISMTNDLAALDGPDVGNGEFATWCKPAVISAYHWAFQCFRSPVDDESGQVYDYGQSKVMRLAESVATMIITLIASLLPALVILWLNRVEHTSSRIWITIGITGALGVLMKLLTTANMKEIFGVTVAFAAVEVVFIGSADGR